MKPALKFGFIYAGISILLMLLMFVTGLNRTDSASYLQLFTLIIPIIMVRMAIIEYRQGPGNGWISFNECFREGMIVMAVGSLVVGLFSIVYNLYIDPDFMKYIMEKQANGMVEQGMSDEQIQRAMSMSMKFMTPQWSFIFGLFGGLFIGAIISLIMAAIMKKPNPEEIV